MSLLMSDEAECAALLRDGSKTFHAASRLLPARVGAAATALYAFCRVADDAVDAHGGAAAAVRDLQGRLARIYAGAPAPIAADRVFARAVALHRIPRELPAALLEGFAWDAAGKRYASLADVLDYAARVAGAVGAMMTVAMGVRSADVLSRACELGVAMQLTNIARDVGEDARAGRLYLPLDWLAAPRMTPALRGVIRRLLDEADRLYAGASPGIAHLPRACRAGIYAARLLYAEIGQCAAATDFDCVAGRAVVPGRRKTVLLMRATALSLLPPAPADAPALPAVRYLVDAAAQTRRPEPRRLPLLRRAEERVVWVMELFASLDARRSAG
jgi:phytoene synthase